MSDVCADHFVLKCPICKPHVKQGAAPAPVPSATRLDSISPPEPPSPSFRSSKAIKIAEAAARFAQYEDAVAEVTALIEEKKSELANLEDRLSQEIKSRDTAQAELRALVEEK